MVKATPAGASVCQSTTAAQAAAVKCLKVESTYDKVLNDFAMPSIGSVITVAVCNAKLYYDGMWLFFPATGDRLFVASRSEANNILYLGNGCSDQVTPVADNRDPGNIITKDSPFTVVDPPDCTTVAELRTKLLQSINTAECLETQALVEAGVTEKVQFVGRVLSDPNNSGFKKCIKRIVGFFADLNGRLFAEKLAYVDETKITEYAELMLHSPTREITRRKLPASRGLVSANQYAMVQFGGAVRYIPKAKVLCPLQTPFVIKDSTGVLEDGAYARTVGDITITSATPYQSTTVLNIPEIDIAANCKEDYFFAVIEITAFLGRTLFFSTPNYPTLKIQDNTITKLTVGDQTMSSVTAIVKVLKSNKEVKLRIESDIVSGSVKACLCAKVVALYL